MKKICKYLLGLCAMTFILLLNDPISLQAAEEENITNVVEDVILKGNADWKWPVPGFNSMSSCYIDGRAHYAIDINAPMGADVYACYEGEVIEIDTSCPHNYPKYESCGCNGDLGNSVSIHHTYNGVDYVSRYGHLTSVNVSVGDIVTEETIIGTIGSTGYSLNYHLDFRIYHGDSIYYSSARDCVDPLLDLFLEIPEGLNVNSASTACCYSYMDEVNKVYEEFYVKKAAEERAIQEALERAEKQAFENAMRNWIEHELIEGKSYLDIKLVEVSLGLDNFISHYNK